MTYMFEDIVDFHAKFGIPTPEAPGFLNDEALRFRCQFMEEELNEFKLAHHGRDMVGSADALVDLAYVVLGTARMMGIPFDRIWDAVHRANMTKVRATDASQSKRGTALDVIKPEGWVSPERDIVIQLKVAGWRE